MLPPELRTQATTTVETIIVERGLSRRQVIGAGAVGLVLGGAAFAVYKRGWPELKRKIPPGFAAVPKASVDSIGRPDAIVPIGEAEATKLVFRFVQGGSLTIGEDATTEHRETVPDFYMSESEVTNGQLRAYFKARRLMPADSFESARLKLIEEAKIPEDQADLHPAVNVAHDVAAEFAKWIGAQLPTEAEWEFAARSRSSAPRKFVWTDEAPFGDNSGRANVGTADSATGGATTKAKAFSDDQTQQGIFDLTGNVREWCRDASKTPGEFVVKGGSWNTTAREFSLRAREFLKADATANDLGFRVVVEVGKPAK